ncbi:L-seryl-tRNA(Sec) kinase [Operophtera brumata]|uniref:L-seryl-tRNA(Sec) kinase n=1 Tax=Operophtera brumata TaxID=104452 RepID=A0A0L7L0W3_OPEBR|nr:L-seryl-tRNA(Sec) kinase [Operophtera brumata]
MDVFAVVLFYLSLASGLDFTTRCLLHNKTCGLLSSFCPPGYTCGWSRCDCDFKMVLDEASSVCVKLASCPVLTIKKQPGKESTELKQMHHKENVIEESDFRYY